MTDDTLLDSRHLTSLLLAIDDDDLADTAIRITAQLAERRNALPAVLHVVDPAPYAPPPGLPTIIAFADALIGSAGSEERTRSIGVRIARAIGRPVPWPIISRIGNPPACIAHEARARGSELVVLGVHRHGTVERLLGGETTVHVLTHAGVSVLGVTSASVSLPRRVLVGVDFGHASARIARLAAHLIEPPGQLILAHVQPATPPTVPETAEGAAVIQQEGIRAAFDTLVHDIAAPAGVTVKTVLLTGEPGSALLQYAGHINPDIIAVASQRRGRFARLLLGSTARHIVRDGRWSVFVTPPD
jgi:nucleotide-binding universal stress UspA family protein